MLVGIERADRLAEHLADAVAAVRARGDVGADAVMARIEADGVVGGSEDHALDALAVGGLEQIVAADNVGLVDLVPTAFDGIAAEMQDAVNRDRGQQGGRAQGGGAGAAAGGDTADRMARAGFDRGTPTKYFEMARTPEKRDPRGYVLPYDQPDFLTATKFINALIKTGVTVHRATSDFQVNGKSYPAGSYVVKTAQAFRPHVLDMFEPQDHPNDFQYPGGPPIPPYDSAGWTLAFQMGVKFDRILDGFDGPFEKVNGLVKPGAPMPRPFPNAAGYFVSHQVNDSFIVTNRLLKEGEEVYWLKQPFEANGKSYPAGTIFIPAKSSTGAKVRSLEVELGVRFEPTASKPAGEAFKLNPVRVGLWDRYGGSMPSGWTRWLLEQFEFPFTVVYPQQLDAGDLASKFDVLIFVSGAIPARSGREGAGDEMGFGRAPRAEEIPEEFRAWLGNITPSKTIPELKKFLDAGGTILTVGSSTNLAYHADLPLGSALVERAGDGNERPLSRDKFYIPGSVLQVRVNNRSPLAYGLPDRLDVFYDNSPVFKLKPEATLRNVRPVAWFESDNPLRSGWAWGQKYLQDGVAVVEAQVGKGKLFMFGPEITFRAQPHGTFKFLFNGIYYGRAENAKF